MPALGSLNHDPSVVVTAHRLHVEQSPRGVRVSLSHPPALLAMLREAMHLVVGLIVAATAVGLGVYLFNTGDGEWWVQALICMVVAALLLGVVAAEAYRNCGIVTDIEVDGDDLVWTKANLWGRCTFRWPIATVRRAHAHGWCVRWKMKRQFTALTIDRRDGGWPLRAFTRCPVEEVREAACTLNRAMGKRE